MFTSFLMVDEAISVFDKWVRRKYITEDELSKILGKFFEGVEELTERGGLILADFDTLTVAFSIEYILKHNIPINDAILLYEALSRKSSIDEFICSDKNLKRAAEKEDFNIFILRNKSTNPLSPEFTIPNPRSQNDVGLRT